MTGKPWLRRHAAAPLHEPALPSPPPSGLHDDLNELTAVPIGAGIYAAGWGSTDRFAAPTKRLLEYIASDGVHDATARRIGGIDSSANANLEVFRIRDAEIPLARSDLRHFEGLRGSTLLFLEGDAALRLSSTLCYQLQKIGVRRLIFRDPFGTETVHALDLRAHNFVTRICKALRLIPHQVGRITNSRWGFFFGATRIAKLSEHSFMTGVIKRIEPLPDAELCTSYALFEGTRQLPPLGTSHTQITLERNGRYSIWNQVVYFSPSRHTNEDMPCYTVVPINEDTKPYLQFSPVLFRSRLTRQSRSERELEDLLANERASEVRLEQGDPLVICTHSLPPGGAERQWVYLAQTLKEAGYSVFFVTFEPLDEHSSHYRPWLQDLGVPLIDATTVPAIDLLQRWPRSELAFSILQSDIMPQRIKLHLLAVNAVFDIIKPKAIIAQLDIPNIVAGFAAHLSGTPISIMSFRNYNPTNFPYIHEPWLLPAYQLLSKSKRILLSGNHGDANRDYAEWIGVPPARVAHIPNAIDPASFSLPSDDEVRNARSSLGLDPDVPVLLGVFRLSAEKDPLGFIEVCARVVKTVPKMRALLVGVGPMQDLVRARIAECKLDSQVEMLGRRADVNVLMKLASLVVLTSIKEGMPNVVMESQLMGTPVVATNVGGTPDTVLEGQSAILKPVGDYDGLAAACSSLLLDPKQAHRMGQAGRDFMISFFPRERIARRYVELIRNRELKPEANVALTAATT